MELEKYLEKIKKNVCPKECELQSKDIEIVTVPPPNEIVGIIISRDPTTEWIENGYEDAKGKSDDKRRKELFETAIPRILIDRICNYIDAKNLEILKKTIYQKVYWTHLHKCFTDKKEKKSLKFKYRNAQECADKWLTKELNTAISNNTKFIIALGGDVQKWISEWREDYHERSKNLKVIYLPHPSPANVGNYSSWSLQARDREKIERRINELLKLCG